VLHRHGPSAVAAVKYGDRIHRGILFFHIPVAVRDLVIGFLAKLEKVVHVV
jgi:hypothetical protein